MTTGGSAGRVGAGEVKMIDIGEKEETERIAVASGRIRMKRETLETVLGGRAPKGDVLGTGRLAGLIAAKRTPEVIPLCHPTRLTSSAISSSAGDGVANARAASTKSRRDG